MSDYQLFNNDCLAVMDGMAAQSVDAVICDPPYGINNMRAGGRGINGWRDYRTANNWDILPPSKEYFDCIFSLAKTVAIWGGNYFTEFLPPSSGWLIWDKGQRNFSLADGEMCWTNRDKAMRIFTFPRGAMLAENGLHPTQKPVDLMIWCIEMMTRPGDTILDPFMGSGTTGVAAMLTGRKFIGIELDETYFAIAEKRIAKAAQQAAGEFVTKAGKASDFDGLPMFGGGE